MVNLLEIRKGILINPDHIVSVEQVMMANGEGVRIQMVTGTNFNLSGKDAAAFWEFLHSPRMQLLGEISRG